MASYAYKVKSPILLLLGKYCQMPMPTSSCNSTLSESPTLNSLLVTRQKLEEMVAFEPQTSLVKSEHEDLLAMHAAPIICLFGQI
jgi:hypothetical protein